MKLLRYSFLLSLVAMFWGCQSNNIDEEHHYTNHLYITSDAICSDLLIKDDVVESTRKIDYRIASPISNDVQMSFEAVPSMTAAYNLYNPQIQISVVSGTKRSIFRQKNKTKRSKKRLHTTLIKPEQKVNEDLCSGFIVS